MFTLIIFYALLSSDGGGNEPNRSPEIKFHDFENKAACETAKRLTLSMAARVQGNGSRLAMDRAIIAECTPKG
jgi:hypothetical protein